MRVPVRERGRECRTMPEHGRGGTRLPKHETWHAAKVRLLLWNATGACVERFATSPQKCASCLSNAFLAPSRGVKAS